MLLTNQFGYCKLGIAGGVMSARGVRKSGGGCPHHPPSFPMWVGNNGSQRQFIPNNQIENRQRMCVCHGASAFCCLTPLSAGQEVALGLYDERRARVRLETVLLNRAGLRTGLKTLWRNLLGSWQFGPNGRPFTPSETTLLVKRRGSIPGL
jgi:hypothetical protein